MEKEESEGKSAASALKTKKNKCKTNKKNRRRRQNQNKSAYNKMHQPFVYTSNLNNRKSHGIWRRTYETMVRWQCEHQVNYWRNQALNFRNVNQQLWNRLQKYEGNTKDSTDKNPSNIHAGGAGVECVYETSSEEEGTNNGDTEEQLENDTLQSNFSVDEDYLKFLEVTHQHRKDLQVTRARESTQQNILDSPEARNYSTV